MKKITGSKVKLAIGLAEYQTRVAFGDWYPKLGQVYTVDDEVDGYVHLQEDPDRNSYFEAGIFEKVN